MIRTIGMTVAMCMVAWLLAVDVVCIVDGYNEVITACGNNVNDYSVSWK